MLKELIAKNRVDFYEKFDNWEDAIRASCSTLIADGSVTEDYAEAILDNVREYGPYIVIADNLAVPHTKAGARGVLRSAVSFTKVKYPVAFEPGNSEKNASLLFTLAARDMDEHYANMERLSEMLMQGDLLQELAQVNDMGALQRLAEKYG